MMVFAAGCDEEGKKEKSFPDARFELTKKSSH